MSKKLSLYGTVSVAALLLSIGAASAQVTENATNSGLVTNEDTLITPGNLGSNVSVSINALGANAAVQYSATNVDFAILDTVADGITATATHTATGTVRTELGLTAGTNHGIRFTPGSATLGTGASASIQSTGASASTSFSGAGPADYNLPEVGNINLTAINRGSVTTVGGGNRAEINAPILSGNASSLNYTATGASASAAIRVIEGTSMGMDGTATIGSVTQTARNFGEVTNQPGNLLGDRIEGHAASITRSATGASAGFSVLGVDTGNFGGVQLGGITQTARSEADVTDVGGARVQSFRPISGSGASITRSASGAVASVGETMVNTPSTAGDFGGVTQTARLLDGTVASTAAGDTQSFTRNGISGTAASARHSLLGAGVSVASTGIETTGFNGSSFGDVTQTALARGGAVGNDVRSNILAGGGGSAPSLSGTAASVSGSAIGASASVSATTINSTGAMASFGTVNQTVENDVNVTYQTDLTLVRADVNENTNITGVAASVQAAATGATSAVTAANIGGTVDGATFGAVTSNVTNTGEVTMGSTDANNTVITGSNILGAGASVGAVAQGASASVGESIIQGTQTSRTTIASVGLTATNTGVVENNGTQINMVGVTAFPADGGLVGTASSVRVGATGANASVSSTMVDGGGLPFVVQGDSSMTAGNAADVSVTGAAITVGGPDDRAPLEGNGASATIAATGAATGLSFTVIDSVTPDNRARVEGVTQQTGNTGDVSVAGGNVAVGALTGAGTSASIGATGAAASIAATGIGGTENGLSGLRVAGTATQNVENSGVVSVTSPTITAGEIGGSAGSASVSARGASGSISHTSIAVDPYSNGTPAADSVFSGAVTQTINNNSGGTVSISGANITVDNITGAAGSASVSAVGASANFSVSSINDVALPTVQVASVTQNVVNNANVTVSGSVVNPGNLTGTSSSASVSAIGASAVTSVTSVALP